MTISPLQGTGPLLDLSAAARSISSAVERSPNASSDTSQTAFTLDVTNGSTATATQADAAGTPTIPQSSGSSNTADTSGAATTDDSLFSEFKSYASASTQKSAAAYQEYVKAWGGRVVHGEVEFPPLSIYLE